MASISRATTPPTTPVHHQKQRDSPSLVEKEPKPRRTSLKLTTSNGSGVTLFTWRAGTSRAGTGSAGTSIDRFGHGFGVPYPTVLSAKPIPKRVKGDETYDRWS